MKLGKATRKLPFNAFLVTGTKLTSVLKDITLRGLDADYFYVVDNGHAESLTRQKDCIITSDGFDVDTGAPAAIAYTRLLQLPKGTRYHERRRFYEKPDGMRLSGEQVDANGKQAENKIQPSDPFAL